MFLNFNNQRGMFTADYRLPEAQSTDLINFLQEMQDPEPEPPALVVGIVQDDLDFLCDGESLYRHGIHDQQIVEDVYHLISGAMDELWMKMTRRIDHQN